MKINWKSTIPSLITIFFLLTLWEGFVYIFQIEKWLLPSPIMIIKELIRSLWIIQKDILATGYIAMLGLLMGLIVGVLTASLLHLFPLYRKVIYPFIVFSQNVPMIVLAPLLIIWFGFGMGSKCIIVFLVCFFPITVATLDGFNQVHSSLQTYLEMEGASRWQRFVRLEWPSALPSFFSGLKLSASYSVMAAVIAEWLGSNNGLGVIMTLAAHSFQMDRVFVVIFLIMLLSVLLFCMVTVIERKIVFWRKNR